LALALAAPAQSRLVIPAGTPEDQAIQAINKEQDLGKRAEQWKEFLEKYAPNPVAVAYGASELSQYYQSTSDLPQAMTYGEQAAAAMPANVDLLVSVASLAQQTKNNAKLVEYACKGGMAIQAMAKQAKPENLAEEEFHAVQAQAMERVRPALEFLESAAFNGIAAEEDPKTRVKYIEQYTLAFPKSRFEEQVMQYAIYSFQQMNQPQKLVEFGEKALAANPDSLPTLVLLANAYSEDQTKPQLGKAIAMAKKAITLANAKAADADRARKLSAGVAHSSLGYALMRQEKTAASVAEFRTAAELLKGEDANTYALALYRMGYALAKLNRMAEARQALSEASRMDTPVKGPAQELLGKITKSAGKGD
jgi:tetratricopeptide (TPR) repeat protein